MLGIFSLMTSSLRPLWVQVIVAFGHRMSRPNKLMGVFSEYSRGAVIGFPDIFMCTGRVRGVIWVVPEKPMVLMDWPERGSEEPSLPIHE